MSKSGISKRALLPPTTAIALLCAITSSSEAVTGDTTRVSVDDSGTRSNNDSFIPSISADGRFMVFTSDASNLVGSDTSSGADVFVRDRKAGNTQTVSVTWRAPFAHSCLVHFNTLRGGCLGLGYGGVRREMGR